MDHVDTESDINQSEIIFWYNVLYIIGSHVIDTAKIINHINESIYDDPISKIFCGYWILSNIEVNSEELHDNI